jgi:Zn-dependent peptidase ImmA (M78 family)/transcriptional regulator with XRE-family HTH domain
MIYGERFRQVRELRKLTQTDVADRLQVTQGLIAQIERGRTKAPDRLVDAFALLTGFPVTFFHRPPSDDFPLGSLLFRAHAGVSAQDRNEIYRYAQVAFDMVRRMLELHPIKERHSLHLPQAVTDGPVVAAKVTRSELGLSPDMPIANLTNTLEKAGVLMIALPVPFDHRDAFSLWAGVVERRPIMVLSGGRPMDRLRLNIGHELGHLVMHQPLRTTVAQVEPEAYQFAAEFLMPADAMQDEIRPPFDLDMFAALKRRWGVSIQALIMRSKELGIITPRKYAYLFQQLGALGWRTHEPHSEAIPVERPRAVRKIAEVAYGIPIKYRKLAADVGLTEPMVRELLSPYRSDDRSATDVRSKQQTARVTNFESARGIRRKS